MVAMSIEGFAIGITLPNIMVMVQNAAERRDVGTATGRDAVPALAWAARSAARWWARC